MSAERDFAAEGSPVSPLSDGENTPITPDDEVSSSAAKTIPVLRPTQDNASGITPSSTHLGQVNAARHGGGASARPQASIGSANQDILAKMKAFQLSRQGAPPPSLSQTNSTGAIPSTGSQPGASTPTGPLSGGNTPAAMNGPLSGTMAGRLHPNHRPAAKNWASAPNMSGSPARGTPSPRGGLAAKRMKPGLKLSDATGPTDSAPGGQSPASGPVGGGESAFSKYSEYIDTKSGTLKFKNKAVLHGGGIEFSSGQSFNISLDEVDRMDELGKGNYGTVYKVKHSRPHMRKPGQGLGGIISRPGAEDSDTDGTPVIKPQDGSLTGAIMAMKEIRLELDESKFAQIIMELDILHRCVSPFIIDFYGAFFQEGAVYICVEFMDGGSIDRLYGDGVPESILRKVALSTVMGLKSLKDDHNIIHRDVKPTNILVNTRGQVKICDFGVSGNLVASIAKTNIGCQSYMAPERIAGGGVQQPGATSGGTYSVQSDIWSLGLSIIECAIGRYPYPPETFNNIFSQLHAIVHGEAPSLPEADYSDDAHSFVNACLDKSPQNRPSYDMLLRHPWLAPLMQPPTEQSNTDIPSMSLSDGTSGEASSPVTDDQEIADWVRARIEKRLSGLANDADRPALHAVALDAVPQSPALDDAPMANLSIASQAE